MKNYKWIAVCLIVLVIMIVVATITRIVLLKGSGFAVPGTATPVTGTSVAVPGTGSNTAGRGTTAPGTQIDTITMKVLENMHLNAWNPEAMTKGQVTGGLLINWKAGDPAIKNVTNAGADGVTMHDHDPQVDLLYLTSLSEYSQLHPNNNMFDADLSRASAIVLSDFRHYSLPKGWIYFYLLKDGLLLHSSELLDEARQVAKNFYLTWYDPTIGTIYNRNHSPGDYDTNYTLESGVALIEAGQRWQMPEWVSAGQKTLDHTLSVAFNQHYHLFYDSMTIESGQEQVGSYKSRPSTDGEAVWALVTAYRLTHNQHYMDVARLVLGSLFTTSGLWDGKRGGFFFSIELHSGKIITNYKETRSQGWVLIGLDAYNRASTQPMTLQEQALIDVIDQRFYLSTYQGFVYRLTPDFHFYVSKAGQGNGLEDYVTTEAMGSTLDALQETELVTPV